MKPNVKIIVFVILLVIIAAIGILHSVTPGHMLLYHDTYRRLSYFPIAIGAILYGLPGGISLAVLSCLAFVPHLYNYWAEGPEAYYSELSEMIFYLAAGLVIGLISSRENRLQEQYKTLSEKLSKSYKRLSKQASQLLKAEKQLGESQKLSMLGHVSASFAHEIKNPLASIKGAAEILADEVGEDHPKHEFVEILRSEISRLNNSVEKVLDYCRGGRQKRPLDYKPVREIVEHVLSLMESRIKDKSIQVAIQYEKDMEEFEVQGPPMIQVLLNVLINAADAVEKKGQILIETILSESGCLICISDDGPGIDDALKKEVFHSFVTYKEGGTGLGLSISKRIIESLAGKIQIEQSRMGGAAICIYLQKKEVS
ncbi:MAG: ATP-binding protein [Desulfobacula sp.]|nr:ATP-binding protein [Desulfobacula sp.]